MLAVYPSDLVVLTRCILGWKYLPANAVDHVHTHVSLQRSLKSGLLSNLDTIDLLCVAGRK